MIAFPGTTAYARNHGVYLTDSQVVPLGQWHGPWSRAGMAAWSCALGGLLPWTFWYSLASEEFPLWPQLSCSLSLWPNLHCTWTLCPALCWAGEDTLSPSPVGWDSAPGSMLVPVGHAQGFSLENTLAVSLS